MLSEELTPRQKLDMGFLLNDVELGELSGLSPVTLRNWRSKGEGPEFVRLGGARAVRYAPDAVRHFLGEHEGRSV